MTTSRWPRLRRHPPTPRLLCVLLLIGAAGCAAAPPPQTAPATATATATAAPAPTATATDIDPALLEPLTGLGPCTAEPNVLDEDPAEGILLPDGAVLTSQTVDGPLTTIKGYAPMTPVQIRVFYQRQDTYDVVQIEDEIRESEVLLADGNNRLFVKAQAICELGSVLLAVLAPESSGDQVPAPAGSG